MAELREDALSVDEVLRAVADPAAGGIGPHRAGRRSPPAGALIDQLKESVPVWKHQVFGDGESEWVNSA